MGFPESPPSSPHFFTPLMIAMVGIIATALVLTTYHLMVSKFCVRRDRVTTQPYYGRDAGTGVDEKILNSIPIHAYMHKQRAMLGVDQCECAICLGEFEEGDPVRVLPNCHHVFHLQCIDDWFISHSNCPLCRSPIVASTSPVLPVIVDTNTAHLSHDSQNEGAIVISINDNEASNSRKSSKVSLRHCSSVLLSVERKPQLAFARLKRSLSDCSCVSIKIDLESGP